MTLLSCGASKTARKTFLAACPRVDLNVKDTAGDTPAMWALKNDNLEMFNILVDYPRTDLDLKDSSDDTLALWALKNDKIETLKQLVGRVDVSMTDKNGDTVAKIARFASDRYLHRCCVIQLGRAKLNPRNWLKVG